MTQMSKEQAEAEIKAAEATYEATCEANRARLMDPVRQDIKRLNATARKMKDERVRALKAWLDVLDTQPVTGESGGE